MDVVKSVRWCQVLVEPFPLLNSLFRQVISMQTMSEPDPKRRRLLKVDGVIEDEESARQKMRDAQVGPGPWKGRGKTAKRTGFDPNNVTKRMLASPYDDEDYFKITPMGYFAQKGDLPMMRWLYANGANTRDTNVSFWFPVYAATVHGHLDACKWLYEHGAADDITRNAVADMMNHRPLKTAFETFRAMSRWMILKGALCESNGSGELDAEVMEQDLGDSGRIFDHGHRKREMLLEWAQDLHQCRKSFVVFLKGTLSRPKLHSYHTRRSSSPLRILSGNPGILERIGDFAGIVRGREARIVRQLVEVLPDFNEELEEARDLWIESFARGSRMRMG